MDEKELEELKKSNPKAYDFIQKQKSDLEAANKKKSEEEDDEKGKKKSKKSRASEEEDDDEEEQEEEEDDGSLRSKVKKEKEAKADKKNETKRLETALKFNLGLNDFVKNNSDLIPEEISEVIKASEKETYDSAIEKASVLKSEMIQSFFSVQSNVDLLTSSQKTTLDDYLKLTKNGKESKAESVFENLFEPALETLRKLKKAEEVGKARAGFGSTSKAEDSYKARLIQTSKKTYLGEKGA